jgi:hypothetical protein
LSQKLEKMVGKGKTGDEKILREESLQRSYRKMMMMMKHLHSLPDYRESIEPRQG